MGKQNKTETQKTDEQTSSAKETNTPPTNTNQPLPPAPSTTQPIPETLPTEPAINITMVKIDSRGSIIWGIIYDGMILLCSYSYSFLLVIASYLVTRLQNNQGTNTEYRAGGALLLSITDLAVVGTVYGPGITTFFSANNIYKQIMEAKTNSQPTSELNKKMSRLVKIGFVLGIPFAATAISFMCLGQLFLPLLGQNQDVIELIQPSLYISSGAILIYLSRFLLEQMHLAGGKKEFVMRMSMLSLLLFGIALPCLLAFGWGPLPNLALNGIFIGIFCENLATTVCSLLGLQYFKEFKDFHFLRSFLSWDKEDTEALRSVAKMAGFLTGTAFIEWAMNVVRTLFAGWLGSDEQAAQNEQQLLIFGLFLIAQACASVVFLKTNHAKYILATGGSLTALAAGTGLAINFSPLQRILNSNASDHVIDLGHRLMPYTAAYGFLYSLAIIIRNSLLAKTGGWPAIKFNASLVIGAITSLILSQYTQFGVEGISAGAIAGIVLGLLAMIKPYWQAFYSPQIEEIKEEKSAPPHAEIEEIKEEASKPASGGENASQPNDDDDDDEDTPRLSSFWGSCLNRVVRRFWPEQNIQTPFSSSP
jgi:Na+-driven multidrug efflux pump